MEVYWSLFVIAYEKRSVKSSSNENFFIAGGTKLLTQDI